MRYLSPLKRALLVAEVFVLNFEPVVDNCIVPEDHLGL
jgi:hypothetical protein